MLFSLARGSKKTALLRGFFTKLVDKAKSKWYNIDRLKKSYQHKGAFTMSHTKYTTDELELQAFLHEKIDQFAKRQNIKKTTVDPLLLNAIDSPSTRLSVAQCGEYIGLDKNGHVVAANFCKHRLCPICCWRHAAKKWHRTYEIIEKLRAEKPYTFMHMTLTVKNCPSEKLSSTISDMLKAVGRMTQNRRWKDRVHGYIRSLEVTYNASTGEYHPHFHYILCLSEDYITNPNIYLSTYDWRKMWEKAAKLDYVSQIDIKVIQGEELSKAVAEVSKYAVKAADIFKRIKDPEELKVLLKAISGRRLYSLGGIIKDHDIKPIKLNADELAEARSAASYYTWENGAYREGANIGS